jgi:hypothetical protein
LNAAKLSDFRRVYRRAAAKKKAVGVRDSWDTSAGSRRTSHGRTPLGLQCLSGSLLSGPEGPEPALGRQGLVKIGSNSAVKLKLTKNHVQMGRFRFKLQLRVM